MSAQLLKTWIGRGLILLVALIPLHAIIVISLGHWFGHQSLWASWKEVLLALLSLLTIALCLRDEEARRRLRQPLVYSATVFAVIAVIITLVLNPGLKSAAFGAKTDFEFIVACLIALTVAGRKLVRALTLTLLASTGLVVAFAIAQATVLPRDMLSHLGYTFAPGQTAPYETVVVGHTIHNRFGSTLGGPNQLGTFLILPLVLSLVFGFKRRRWWLLTAAIIPALFITYSRSAWLGATLSSFMVIVTVVTPRTKIIVTSIAGLLALTVIVVALMAPSQSSIVQYFHHPALNGAAQNSDTQHLSSLRDGSKTVLAAPLGHGLGTAGPATFHAGAPNIIENNYLQIAYETGLLGLAAFIVFVSFAAASLLRQASLTSAATAAAILGISVTALLLPAWTDTSTALTVWTLAGAGLGARHV